MNNVLLLIGVNLRACVRCTYTTPSRIAAVPIVPCPHPASARLLRLSMLQSPFAPLKPGTCWAERTQEYSSSSSVCPVEQRFVESTHPGHQAYRICILNNDRVRRPCQHARCDVLYSGVVWK